MDNFCNKIPFLPSICASVTLRKLNWSGIPIMMTSLIPGDGQCMLPTSAQLISTYWQSTHASICIWMLPVVIRITFIPKEVGSFATTMLPTPQSVKIRYFSHHFSINKPSLTQISSIGKDIWQISGSSLRPFWNTLHLRVCRALSTKADTDLPMNTTETTAATLVLAFNSHMIYLLGKQLLFYHKSCRHFKHISEMLIHADGLCPSHVHWKDIRKYEIYHNAVHISKPIEHVTCNSPDLKRTLWRRIAGMFVWLYSWGRLICLPLVSLWL